MYKNGAKSNANRKSAGVSFEAEARSYQTCLTFASSNHNISIPAGFPENMKFWAPDFLVGRDLSMVLNCTKAPRPGVFQLPVSFNRRALVRWGATASAMTLEGCGIQVAMMKLKRPKAVGETMSRPVVGCSAQPL